MEYEIVATAEEKERFKKVARAKICMKGFTLLEFSKNAGYSPKTVYGFFKKGGWSRFFAAHLAEVLKIREEEWR